MTQALADMRRDYTRDGLSEAQAPSEPFALFHQWFGDAVKTEQPPVEANAMTLATVDQDGRPHCRILLLKGLDAQGFTFFTNYQSAKGEQLAARPFAAGVAALALAGAGFLAAGLAGAFLAAGLAAAFLATGAFFAAALAAGAGAGTSCTATISATGGVLPDWYLLSKANIVVR